jgi:hypothetical protein
MDALALIGTTLVWIMLFDLVFVALLEARTIGGILQKLATSIVRHTNA